MLSNSPVLTEVFRNTYFKTAQQKQSKCQMAKAPQSFYVKDILECHRRAQKENYTEAIDSASLAAHYSHKLYTVIGSNQNIKITTPADFFMFRAIMDAQENSQIFC